MKHKVSCAMCGKEGEVLILFGKILSRKWFFFGVIAIEGRPEYWECRKCFKHGYPKDIK